MWKQQIALQMNVGFATLGRLSCNRMVAVTGLFFCDEGIVGCWARRKNHQFCPEPFYIANTGHDWSLVRQIRLPLADMGFSVPHRGRIGDEQAEKCGTWPFRECGKTSKQNHPEYI